MAWLISVREMHPWKFGQRKVCGTATNWIWEGVDESKGRRAGVKAKDGGNEPCIGSAPISFRYPYTIHHLNDVFLQGHIRRKPSKLATVIPNYFCCCSFMYPRYSIVLQNMDSNRCFIHVWDLYASPVLYETDIYYVCGILAQPRT